VSSADRLRQLLLTPEAAAAMDAPGSTDAAVLIPLFARDAELHAVFTERRADMRRHAGEISFPGGRQDQPDEDLRETALREAEEEIGLPRGAVELVGALPPTGTFVTSYRIHPFVGLIAPGHEWTPQPTEVETVLELSLPALVRGHEMKRLLGKGVPFKTPTYTVDGHFVWGATARIVQELLERLEPVL
jgi:8-oxo-dGTP pyrophosphatase MutT (NUDIX family)